MPTVPVTFNYIWDFGSTFGGIRDHNGWELRATYKDSAGVDHSIIRTRDSNIADLSPFSFDVDLDALFPDGANMPSFWPSGAPFESGYFSANLIYPDSLYEIYNFDFRVHVVGQAGFKATHVGPKLQAYLVQPPRESEELPADEPMPLQLTLEYPVPGPIYDNFSYLKFQNRGLSDLSIGGTLDAAWGDGEVSSQAFSYTLPAATVANNGSRPLSTTLAALTTYLKRIPVLRVVTDNSLTDVAAPVVITDTDTVYIAEIRVPRFTHYYSTLENDNPTLAATSNYGRNYPQANDPIPVANFQAADGEDINELDYLHLDGSTSFDLTDDISVWAWYWTTYAEGVDPGLEPNLDFSHHHTITPILSVPTVLSGDYWVYLIAGNDGSLDPSHTPFYRYRQRSVARRKRVTIGGTSGLIFDSHRMSWWHLYGVSGQMRVSRHLEFEPPGSAGVAVGAGVPGGIALAGAHQLVTSKTGSFYKSNNEGQTWEYVMAIASGVSLVAMAAEPDGGTVYHLVLGAGDVLQRVVVRRNGFSWVADAPEPVTGLPESTRRPGAAVLSGATILLTARSDDGVFAATSNDGMKTWTVNI